MNRILDIGYSLSVPEKNDGCFVIKKILGTGASSVTYLAELNQTEHILKECNPLGLHMHREDNGVLVPDTELNKTKFEEYLTHFIDGVNKQLTFRLTDDLKNTTSNVQAIYHANGTVYIDMTFFNGATYDQIEDESLYILLKRMKTLANIIGHYHDMGYLYLDIKPQNIYTIPETPEMVMMFDFDSVVLQENVEKMVLLSYTDSWAAPEQKMAKYRKSICKATDLFAIGEIIFYRVMGRHSTSDERFDFSKYSYDTKAPIFKDVNPKVRSLLDELFHKTLCYSPSARYQSTEELVELLEKAIPLAQTDKLFLVGIPPEPKPFFIGRDEKIDEIHTQLQQNSVLFLHGIGGIGKTELAKQYAKKYYKDAYDTVLFVPYVNNIISSIANDNNIQINNFSRDDENNKGKKIEDYYINKLKTIRKLINNTPQRTLLIVDNLDTYEDCNITDLSTLGCKVLVTSRVDFRNYDFATQMDVEEFTDPTIARQIFDYHYKATLSDKENKNIEAIISLVHGHTMAIELIAKQIDAEWSTTQEIRENLEKGGIAFIGDEDVDTSKDGKLSSDSAFGHIKSLFDLSIFEKESKENELYVLVNLSLIPYTGIDRKLFAEWCELNKHGGKTCINNLIKSGWVQLTSETKLALHPVIADVLREELKRDFSACDRLIKSINKYIKENSSTLLKDQEFISQANYICKTICNFDVFSIFAVGLIGKVTDVFYKASNPYEYASYFKKAITVFEQMSCKTDKALASMYNTLGTLYQRAESFNEAEVSYIHGLSIIDASKNDLLIIKASVYNNLASLYHDMDWLDKAQEMYEKALSTRLKLYGEQHEETAVSYNNLGVFTNKCGDFSKAKEYFEKALQIWSKALGPQHPNVASCYSNIGSIYAEQHMFEQAEEYFRWALAIEIKQYGEYNTDVATSYNSLGMLYKKWNQFDMAEEYYLKSLQIRQKIFGERHSSTASTYMNLSSFYLDIGNIKKAEKLCKKALDIFVETLSEKHHLTATGYSHLGTLHLQLGNYDLAEKLYKKALDIRMDLYGNMHPDTVRSQNDLGAVYLKSGKYNKAAEYFSDAVEKMHSIYGKYHGTVAVQYLNLASAYLYMEQYDQAEVYYKKSLAINQMIFGEKHNETATSYNNLGALYETWGNIEKAEVFHVKANKILTELYGENSLKVVPSYQNLGVIYRKQGKYQDAIIYLQKAYDISLREYGKLHDGVASAHSALGYTYMLCNEFEKAHYNLTEALHIRKQLYGEEHEKVKLVQERIQELHSLMRQSQD